MLITQLKSKETIEALARGKTLIINCHGCQEVYFPEAEAIALQKELAASGDVIAVVDAEYICNPDNMLARLEKYSDKIKDADTVLIFSCGVGVQTFARRFEGKTVYACCDTYPLPGFQGVTPQEYDCDQCGECYLNFTGGICPITACSKSLVNGQCGGAKNGQCEVSADMECGWVRIYKRLEELGRLDTLNYPAKVRNYATELNKSADN